MKQNRKSTPSASEADSDRVSMSLIAQHHRREVVVATAITTTEAAAARRESRAAAAAVAAAAPTTKKCAPTTSTTGKMQNDAKAHGAPCTPEPPSHQKARPADR